MSAKVLAQSADWQSPSPHKSALSPQAWTHHVRAQPETMAFPSPPAGSPMSVSRQRFVRAPANWCPHPVHLIMSSFDPTTVRQAVSEFAPLRAERFRELSAAKDFISELRQKRASYRAIADLLTRHSLPISKTAVADFCHEVLGETSRHQKHRPQKRPPISPVSNAESSSPVAPPLAPLTTGNPGENQQPRVRGPRIAQIRMLKPLNQ